MVRRIVVISAVTLVIIAALLESLFSAKYRISVATGCIPEHFWNKNMSLWSDPVTHASLVGSAIHAAR